MKLAFQQIKRNGVVSTILCVNPTKEKVEDLAVGEEKGKQLEAIMTED